MSINLRQVDLNLLTIFESLMQTHNLSHTAEILGMTQPAVSQSLKRLQRMYNDPLLVHSNRKMHPTLKAQSIFPAVVEILEKVRFTLPIKGSFSPKELNLEFRINIPYLDHYPFIFEFIKQINEQAPYIKVSLTNNLLDDPEKSFRNKEYDLQIDIFDINNTACFNKVLYTDHPVIIARKDHPRLGNASKLTLEQYLFEHHAVLSPTTKATHPLSQIVNAVRDRKIGFTASNFKDIIEAVLVSDVIATTPKGNTHSSRIADNLTMMPIPFKSEREMLIYMSWHTNVEHYQPHRWIRDLLSTICKDYDVEKA